MKFGNENLKIKFLSLVVAVEFNLSLKSVENVTTVSTLRVIDKICRDNGATEVCSIKLIFSFVLFIRAFREIHIQTKENVLLWLLYEKEFKYKKRTANKVCVPPILLLNIARVACAAIYFEFVSFYSEVEQSLAGLISDRATDEVVEALTRYRRGLGISDSPSMHFDDHQTPDVVRSRSSQVSRRFSDRKRHFSVT